jgi:ribokinase
MGIVVNLGVFVADTAYRAERAPKMGETVLGKSFALGPGGKGSNQSVASAMAGAQTHFISRLGVDDFAQMALATWKKAGVIPAVVQDASSYTGAAYIFIEDATGNNAIIISPGAAAQISEADVDRNRALIEGADVFITQLEQPIGVAFHALRLARAAGVTTILNPAPAASLPAGMLGFCDYVTPNESEAEALTGIAVTGPDSAKRAAEALLGLGAGTAIVTLGAQGVLYHDRVQTVHFPIISAGLVVETTGAGDAFSGGFAAALAEGQSPLSAVRFGNAVAGISVTRPGTAPSMPARAELDGLLARS